MEDEAAVGLLGGGDRSRRSSSATLPPASVRQPNRCARRGMPQATPAARGSVKAATPARSATVEHHRLQLGHLLDRGPRALLADPAALETAVRHRVGAPERRRVDLDRAAVDLGGEAQRALEVGGEEPGAEPVVAVVRERDRLVDARPPGSARPPGRTARLREMSSDGSTSPRMLGATTAPSRSPPVTSVAPAATASRIVPLDAHRLRLGDHRAEPGALVERVPRAEALDERRQAARRTRRRPRGRRAPAARRCTPGRR